jgi:hypothetical protein
MENTVNKKIIKFNNKMFDWFDPRVSFYQAIQKLDLLLPLKASYRLNSFCKKVTTSALYLLYVEKRDAIISEYKNQKEEDLKESLKKENLPDKDYKAIVAQQMERLILTPETINKWKELYDMPVDFEMERLVIDSNQIDELKYLTDDNEKARRSLHGADWNILREFIDFENID